MATARFRPSAPTGGIVAFVSEASNLLDDDENKAADVFLFDREADGSTWVSRAAGRIVGWRREHPSGYLRQRPLRGLSIRCRESGLRQALLLNRPRTSIFCGTRFSSIARPANIIRISEDELGGWMEASAGAALDAAAMSSRSPRVTRRCRRPRRRLRSLRSRADTSACGHPQVSLRRRGHSTLSVPGAKPCQIRHHAFPRRGSCHFRAHVSGSRAPLPAVPPATVALSRSVH